MLWRRLLCLYLSQAALSMCSAGSQSTIPGRLSFAAPPKATGGSKWDWRGRGDVRALVNVSATVLREAAGGSLAAIVEWRRRDANPDQKAIIVTDGTGQVLPSRHNVSAPVVQSHKGVIVFLPHPTPQCYYIYYMPYTQSGVGHANMKWLAAGDTSPSFSLAGRFTAKAGLHTRQEFVLPHPVTASHFEWTCTHTYGSWQGFLAELSFRATNGTWLPNHASGTAPAPVVSATSWQPNGDGSGEAWTAMDGNRSTFWDPQGTPASLTLAYQRPVAIDAVGVVSWGDTTHDIKVFTLGYRNDSAKHNDTWWQLLPRVSASIEARDSFHSIIPMAFPANSTEVASMLADHPPSDGTGLLVFPEPREHKIKMSDRIPHIWTIRGPSASFMGNVTRGEVFYFQVGLLATKNLSSVTLAPFELVFQLQNGSSVTVRSQCLNTEGSTSLGEDVTPSTRPLIPGFDSFLVSMTAGSVKALWIGVEVPSSCSVGTTAQASAILTTIDANGESASRAIHTTLTVSAAPVSKDRGYGNLEQYSRLAWLNSKLAIDDEVVAPYTALTVTSSPSPAGSLFIELLNRRVTLGPIGLPTAVRVTRPASAHGVVRARDIELLAKPVSLAFIRGGAPLVLNVRQSAAITKRTLASISWTAVFEVGTVAVKLNGTLHFDGYIDFVFELSSDIVDRVGAAESLVVFDDIQLNVEWLPQGKERLLLMGMGVVSAPFETNTSLTWRWSTAHRNNFMWAGSASAGIKLQLKDDNDPHRDAAIKSYSTLPLSWDNHGRGGANISAVGTGAGAPLGANFAAFTGPFTLGPVVKPPLTNGSRTFRFDMTITPFKPRNESQHWGLRHFQVGYPGSSFTSAEDVAKTGATVVNIHQGVDTMINPCLP